MLTLKSGNNAIAYASYSSSNSIIYRCINGNGSFAGTTNYGTPSARLVNRIALFDQSSQNSRFGFATMPDSRYDPATYTTSHDCYIYDI